MSVLGVVAALYRRFGSPGIVRGSQSLRAIKGCLSALRDPPVFTDAIDVWNEVSRVLTQREAKDRIRAASEEPF